MERSFRDCSLFLDLIPSHRQQAWLEEHREVLLDGAKWLDLLEAGFTWKDLLEFLETCFLAWMSKHVFITSDEGSWRDAVHEYTGNYGEYFYNWSCTKLVVEHDNGEMDGVFVVSLKRFDATSRDPAFEMIGQLLAQQPVRLVSLTPLTYPEDDWSEENERLPLAPPTLTKFLDSSQVHGQVEIRWASFSEEQCQVFSTYRGSLSLDHCETNDAFSSILSEVANGRGPTKLNLLGERVYADSEALCDALSNSTSLTKLEWRSVSDFSNFCDALGQNRSLVSLKLDFEYCGPITGVQWRALCQSVKSHPTLESVELGLEGVEEDEPEDEQIGEEESDSYYDEKWQRACERRSRVVVDALSVNEVLCEFEIEEPWLIDEVIMEQEIKPLLKRNKYRKRLKALVEDEEVDKAILLRSAFSNPVINGSPTLLFFLVSKLHQELAAALASVSVESKVEAVEQNDGVAHRKSKKRSKRKRSRRS